MKAAGTIVSTSLFAVLFLLCLAFAAMRISGLGTFIVTGGSMEPTIHKGSLILVQPAQPGEVRLGDVITFDKYDQTTSHRVIAITPTPAGTTFTTKGDANVAADPEASMFPGRVGIVRATVPLAGYLVDSVQAYWRIALSVIAALVFFVCAGSLVFGPKTQVRAPARVADRRARLVPVTVSSDEAAAAWNAHLEWLERSRARDLRVA